MILSAPTPIEVFYSYAHEDRPLRDELEKHLKLLHRQGLIIQWYDHYISPGSNRPQAISMHLERASVILLLVSADFLASDYCYGVEMQRALERHRNKEARVIPILLRPVDYKGAPFAQLRTLPTNTKPITSWSNQDEAFADVAASLRQAIEDLSLLLNSEQRHQNLEPLPNPTGSMREAVILDPNDMVIPPALNDLANILKLRNKQQDKTYNLLLTSTISLTPDVLRQICASDRWTKFQTYLNRRDAGSSNLIDLLTNHVGIHNNLDGYRALARLIEKGYFSTILTTNLDSTLEDMLLQVGLQPAAFQTLIVGQHKDESIANALEGSRSGIRIIKLHGSLRESVLPKQFPDFFELPAAIRENLSESLNQDIVIVGSIKRDKDIMRLLDASKRNQIYYVIPRKSSCDEVIKLITARGNIPRSSLILGPSGEFATFFKLLETKLLPSRGLGPLQTSLSDRRY